MFDINNPRLDDLGDTLHTLDSERQANPGRKVYISVGTIQESEQGLYADYIRGLQATLGIISRDYEAKHSGSVYAKLEGGRRFDMEAEAWVVEYFLSLR